MPISSDNQRLYLNDARVAQMSDTQPLDLNSNPVSLKPEPSRAPGWTGSGPRRDQEQVPASGSIDRDRRQPYEHIHATCGVDFFDDLITHSEVATAYERYLDGAFLRQGQARRVRRPRLEPGC